MGRFTSRSGGQIAPVSACCPARLQSLWLFHSFVSLSAAPRPTFPFSISKTYSQLSRERCCHSSYCLSLLSFDIIYAILHSARRRGINICKVFLSLFPFEGACNEMVHICWPFFWFTGKCHARYVTLSCCCCWQHKTSASINYHFISGARQFDVTPRSTIVRRRWRCDGSSSWWRHRLTADDEKPCFSIFNE